MVGKGEAIPADFDLDLAIFLQSTQTTSYHNHLMQTSHVLLSCLVIFEKQTHHHQ
jgi:hypothetical protein